MGSRELKVDAILEKPSALDQIKVDLTQTKEDIKKFSRMTSQDHEPHGKHS